MYRERQRKYKMTDEKRRAAGRPRIYRDVGEANRAMKQRRADRLRAAGWVRPGWWFNQKTVEKVRQSRLQGESLDQTANRLINQALGSSDEPDGYPN